MGKLIEKELFIEMLINNLKARFEGRGLKIDRYEPIVRTGISREETVAMVKEMCNGFEFEVHEENLAIELRAIPFHTPNDVHNILRKFELNRKRIRTNAICFGITLLCCVGGFYFLTKVNLFLSVFISSLGSGLITFVWDNKENPGVVPGSDL